MSGLGVCSTYRAQSEFASYIVRFSDKLNFSNKLVDI